MDDLAQAYLAALTTAPPRSAYAIADDEPLRLRELTDLTTDALGLPRTGTAPPALISLFLGPVLVRSLVTSFRIDASRAHREIGWHPEHPQFRDAVAEVVAATPP